MISFLSFKDFVRDIGNVIFGSNDSGDSLSIKRIRLGDIMIFTSLIDKVCIEMMNLFIVMTVLSDEVIDIDRIVSSHFKSEEDVGTVIIREASDLIKEKKNI